MIFYSKDGYKTEINAKIITDFKPDSNYGIRVYYAIEIMYNQNNVYKMPYSCNAYSLDNKNRVTIQEFRKEYKKEMKKLVIEV